MLPIYFSGVLVLVGDCTDNACLELTRCVHDCLCKGRWYRQYDGLSLLYLGPRAPLSLPWAMWFQCWSLMQPLALFSMSASPLRSLINSWSKEFGILG